jgi:hypothetical protein
MDALDWLLDSDPPSAVQVTRDLTDATSPAAIAAERARVAREGLGAQILARQQSDGSWRRPDAPAWLPTPRAWFSSSSIFGLCLRSSVVRAAKDFDGVRKQVRNRIQRFDRSLGTTR